MYARYEIESGGFMKRTTVRLMGFPSIVSVVAALSLISAWAARPEDDLRLTIDAGRPVAKTSPMLYGLMTEEINYSYDGGLYAELIRNRAFLDNARTPVHWTAVQ